MKRLWDWICGAAARRKGYRAGYKSGRSAGEQAGQLLIEEARLQAQTIYQDGVDQCAAVMRKAKEDGHEAGRREGYQKGHAAGREDGKRAAYVQAAEHLGFTPDNEVPEASTLPAIDMSGVRPNIYQMHGVYRVRVIVNGLRREQDFEFERKREQIQDPRASWRKITVYRGIPESMLQAMLKAIAFRNSLIDFSHRHQALWDEICQENIEATSLQLAEEFHRRLQQTELGIDEVGFVGEDPEDRLEIEDTALMVRPWTALFEKVPHRISNAFDALGIGSKENPRTVRDMLLLTPQELLKVNDFGRVTLNKLKEGLREHGLALWGDDVPPPPPPERRAGGREFRAIDLGFDDE